MVASRSGLSLLLLAAAASAASPAQAAGAFFSSPPATAQLAEARVALARGPTRSTLWAQLRFAGAPDEILWVLPLPAGVGVDVGLPGLLDALEASTAPRVGPPPGQPPKGLTCSKPAYSTISTGDGEPPAKLLEHKVFADTTALIDQAMAWGYDGPELAASALEPGPGGLLALRLDAQAGASSTLALRLHGPDAGLAALASLRASPIEPLPWTLWLVGDGRGAAAPFTETQIEPSALRWLSPSQTNFAALRGSLLAKGKGGSLLIEAAGPGPLRDAALLPGGDIVLPVVDAYLARAVERGDLQGNPEQFASDIHTQLAQGTFDEPCPRGDLLPHDGFTCDPAGGKPASLLAPSPSADDLAFLFPGDPTKRWVSRFSGLLPASGKGQAAQASFPAAGKEIAINYTPAGVWDALCVTGAGGSSQGGAPGTGGSGLSGGTGFAGGGVTPGSGASTGAPREQYEPPGNDTQTNVSCWGSTSDNSSNDTCNCSDGTGSGESDSGDDCTSEESGASDEGCSCNDSSSGSDGGDCGGDSSGSSGGDACSGSDSGGGDSCSGSNGGGDSCGKGDCAVGKDRGRKRPLRLSKWLMLAALMALPLRRWSRRPRR